MPSKTIGQRSGRSCKVTQIFSESLKYDSHPKSFVQDRVPTVARTLVRAPANAGVGSLRKCKSSILSGLPQAKPLTRTATRPYLPAQATSIKMDLHILYPEPKSVLQGLMLEIDLTLPHSFEIEEIGDFPGTGKFRDPIMYFPRPQEGREGGGLWLKVKTESGKSWIGVFAFGYSSPPAFSRVVSTPDRDRLCVIAKGAAYVVKSDEPEVWDKIPVDPVLDVRLVPEKELMVFSDFIRLAAYRRGTVAWRSPRVCWDALKIIRITGEAIEGIGYDPTNSVTRELPFSVDLETGRSMLSEPTSIDGRPVW
jgi:hypothetical protein